MRIDSKVFEKVEKGTKVESPGMKYRHYAPKTKCKLIYSKEENVQLEIVNTLIEEYDKDVIVLCFDEHKDKVCVDNSKIISIGSKNIEETIAKNIYSALREADKMNAKIILIEGVEKQGIGIAIMNRLLRTCEYDYIEK